ncbi:hypothetical protein ACQP00_33655 [Dactylosporangium sp. CS-047395]|uniref:hypothetical protein n=1 Tax=Dactylosporangium sp. CS-047395 TaxID=3239936 RepID=UPI003D938EF7
MRSKLVAWYGIALAIAAGIFGGGLIGSARADGWAAAFGAIGAVAWFRSARGRARPTLAGFTVAAAIQAGLGSGILIRHLWQHPADAIAWLALVAPLAVLTIPVRAGAAEDGHLRYRRSLGLWVFVLAIVWGLLAPGPLGVGIAVVLGFTGAFAVCSVAFESNPVGLLAMPAALVLLLTGPLGAPLLWLDVFGETEQCRVLGYDTNLGTYRNGDPSTSYEYTLTCGRLASGEHHAVGTLVPVVFDRTGIVRPSFAADRPTGGAALWLWIGVLVPAAILGAFALSRAKVHPDRHI